MSGKENPEIPPVEVDKDAFHQISESDDRSDAGETLHG